LSKLSEFDWISEIGRRQGVDRRVALGIGDDAALLWGGPSDWLVTVDMLVEQVHFLLETPRRLVGRKALAVNLSDIAAMAGRPVAALVAVALPAGTSPAAADELYAGIEELAREFDVAIVGGDTNQSKGGWVVSITVLGHPTGRGAVRRAGARPGDKLMVTGKLGGSLGGRHLTFRPRVAEAQRLHQLVELHAMMDLSDGLGGDVFHLARESHCGMIIDGWRLPIHEDVGDEGDSALKHALSDGEDFELLFVVNEEEAAELERTQPLGEVRVTVVGEVTTGGGVFLRSENGGLRAMLPTGYVHQM
jgi:thiamine-monophosphate kinase